MKLTQNKNTTKHGNQAGSGWGPFVFDSPCGLRQETGQERDRMRAGLDRVKSRT